MANIDIDERRGEIRYPIKDSSAVLLSPDNIVSYALLDISESGLAFAYNGPSTEVTLQGDGQIDLFGEAVLVSDMKIKIISDSALTKADTSRYQEGDKNTHLYLRRCGVQFVDMAQTQAKIIASYVKQFGGELD